MDASDPPVCATPGIYSDASRKKTGPRMRMKFRISQSLCFEAKATVLLAFWIAVTPLVLSRGSTRVCFPRRSDLDEGSVERRERRERCGMSFYCRVAFSRGSVQVLVTWWLFLTAHCRLCDYCVQDGPEEFLDHVHIIRSMYIIIIKRGNLGLLDLLLPFYVHA